MTQAASVDPVNRWTSRVIPAILLALIGIATYVVTKRVCIDILIPGDELPSAIAILVLLWFFLVLTVVCYARTIHTILSNPGVGSVGVGYTRPKPPRLTRRKSQRHEDTTVAAEEGRGGSHKDPALEPFWMKDVFVCTEQGFPVWCATCQYWKPDRAHHSKELGRCVRKMDHYCPWAGGIISETSFKYFIQFNMYAAFFCCVCLGSSAYILHKEITQGLELDVWIVIIVALGGFFGLFTGTMATNSMRFACLNLTTIDSLESQVVVYFLAIRVPRSVPPSMDYKLVTFPHTGAPNPTGSLHTFAVVKTEPGENPWDLGLYKNWKSIMGETVVDWLLPIRPSPETKYESTISDYPLGPVYQTLRSRHDLGTLEGVDEKNRRKRKNRF